MWQALVSTARQLLHDAPRTLLRPRFPPVPRPTARPDVREYQPLERVVLTDGVGRTLFEEYAAHRAAACGEEETGWFLLGLREQNQAVVLATLPAGTLSGAPKVRAMQIIDDLEPTKRGVYGGVVGYIDFSGNIDTAIAIRTMVVDPHGRASVQAGAGIVADSDPAAEDEECFNKAAALLAAVPAARRMTAGRHA